MDKLYYQGLIYSLEEKLGVASLKNGEYPEDLDTTKIQDRLTKSQIGFCVQGMNNYHYRFGIIKSAPYIIYYKGNIDILNKKTLGIVGPRLMTKYGEEVLKKTFEYLAGYDVVTVSGLADGVDKMAHNLSILAGIPTIAVLGGGLGFFLSSDKRDLIDKIVSAGGLVLSEFKIKGQPAPYTFPQRNRIIAGLSDMLFIPEASEKSGSLITASDARDMNKKVFVAPGNIFSETSKGVHRLASDKKASLVHDLQEFVQNSFQKKQSDKDSVLQNIKKFELSSQETEVLKSISSGTGETVMISSNLNIELGELMTIMTMLEIKGLVYQSEPGKYETK